jgi:hypothetical protein
MPCARKQMSGLASTSWMRLISFTASLAGLEAFLLQESHKDLCGARVEPFGGSFPFNTAFMAFWIRSAGGGQPGR